MSRFLMAHQHN